MSLLVLLLVLLLLLPLLQIMPPLLLLLLLLLALLLHLSTMPRNLIPSPLSEQNGRASSGKPTATTVRTWSWQRK